MAWTLTVYDPTGTTSQGVLAEAHGVGISAHADRLSSVLTFTVDLESTADVALLQPRRVVKVTDGATDLGGYFVHDMPALVAEPGELPGISYTCLSLESWLGGGRVGGAVVYPFGGVAGKERTDILNEYDPRRFGWHQRDYDDAGWGTPNSRGTQGNPNPLIEAFEGEPAEWVDPDAQWLWSRAAYDATGEGGLTDDLGTAYFRGEWDSSALSSGTVVRVYVTAIANWTLYVNGVQRARHRRQVQGDWRRPYIFDVTVGPDGMLFALDATGGGRTSAFGPISDSVGGFLMSVHTLDEFDQPDEVVFRTTTSNFVALDYPETVPGVSVGFVLKRLVDEAQDRGALTGLTYTFTDTADSDATAWPTELTHGWRLGSTLGWVAEQLTEFGCDFRVTSSGVLVVQAKGGTDLSGTVDLDRVESASLSGQGLEGNAALVVTPGGVDERTSVLSVGSYGRVETGAAFGTSDQPETIDAPVAELLSRTAWPRDDGQVALSEASPQPFVDFDLLDWVSFPARDGTTQVGRVMQIDGSQNDADGSVDWTVTLDAVSASTNPVTSTVEENV